MNLYMLLAHPSMWIKHFQRMIKSMNSMHDIYFFPYFHHFLGARTCNSFNSMLMLWVWYACTISLACYCFTCIMIRIIVSIDWILRSRHVQSIDFKQARTVESLGLINYLNIDIRDRGLTTVYISVCSQQSIKSNMQFVIFEIDNWCIFKS